MGLDRLAQNAKGDPKANLLLRVIKDELRQLDQATPSGVAGLVYSKPRVKGKARMERWLYFRHPGSRNFH